MTTVETLSPQIVGQAENAHGPALDRALSDTGLSRHQWFALALAHKLGTASRATLIAAVRGALKVTPAVAQQALADLASRDLIAADSTEPEGATNLTETGSALHAQVRRRVDEVVTRAYAGSSPEDLATAARVLIQITGRLNDLTAEPMAAGATP